MQSGIFSVLFIIFFGILEFPNDIKRIQLAGTAQGTTYHITYFAMDTVVSKFQVDSLLNSIDSSLSLYKEYSLINRFNRSGSGVAADGHFKKVVDKAMRVFRQTDGVFDITVEPLTTAWGFGPAPVKALPDSGRISELLSCVNTKLIYWDKNYLRKRETCVRLDANGIAQGYSVDVLSQFLEKNNIFNYLVELGGEVRARGRKLPGGEKMSVGIEAPGEDPLFSVIEKVAWIDKGALTTSGNYRRYYESNGKKVTHLINPKTGYSIQNDLISVTVFAGDAITADAYDNALMAMGLKKALDFVEKRKDLAAHFIYYTKDGRVADTMSRRFRVLLKP